MGHEGMEKSEIPCGVVTVSSSRTEDTDESGQRLVEQLRADGHRVVEKDLVPDNPPEVEDRIRDALSSEIRVLILTGGTGLSTSDQTVDVLAKLEDRELPGFGERFRSLSYEDIGPRAILSRARASLAGDTLIFALPGSTAAVELAMNKLILPTIGHALYEMDKEER
ncbi:molybdenum cofactor biosynthesis protein MoaB [Candidatus Bipolaricaulota bacterium]|nr:molybdenum cofactor biosynthesis protein MoaB [Candidatus Bipolaricaulota bacterium]